MISFNSVGDTPNYTLNWSVLDHVDSTKYWGVTLNQIAGSTTYIITKC